MEYQLRIFAAKPGELEAFVDEWRRLVVPLRRAKGFEIVGAWHATEDESFVWILAYDGDFAAADTAYYESPERHALDPDPARHLAHTQQLMLRRVL